MMQEPRKTYSWAFKLEAIRRLLKDRRLIFYRHVEPYVRVNAELLVIRVGIDGGLQTFVSLISASPRSGGFPIHHSRFGLLTNG